MRKLITCVAVETILAAAVIAALPPGAVGSQQPESAAAQSDSVVRWLPATPQKLPRWRGFNLLEKFHLGSGRKPFLEEDFRLIAKLGFNFVRLPMDYRFWIVRPKGTVPLKGTVPFSPDENRDSPHDENRDSPREQFDEATLREIDQAVEWGRRYGVHVCINFHRAPGYTVADPPERTNLWTDPQPQRACAAHWAMFARRYRGIPNERLSFNLVNEPGHVEPKVYAAVVARLAAAIRAEDPRRLIIADGLEWGRLPVPELAPLRVAQAGRGYTPMELSHYQASWVHGERFPRPQWPRPVPPNGTPFGLPVEDRAWLWKTCIEPWQAVESRGVGVMVGEWGVFNRTPHDVVLRWAEDSLRNWQQAGWGWAMWNFRGSMGIIDSGRDDVQYEDLAGHKLDRQLLDLLQRY